MLRLKAAGLAAVLTAATVLSGAVATGTAGEPSDPAAPVPAATGAVAGVVTLITGDRVTVLESPDGSLSGDVLPAPGREHIAFAQQSGPGRLEVVPSDAANMVTSGQLDARLFDVAYQLQVGYDDASRTDIPLIMSYDDAARSRAAVTTAGAETTLALPAIGGDAVEVTKADAAGFWQQVGGQRARTAGVGTIWLDARVEASLDVSVPQIGAPEAWAAGVTGDGVTVAVLDTGIDPAHPDLADAVTEVRDFTGLVPSGLDGHGHGTHVASIITGSGAASGGRYAGVAGDAELVVGKVLGNDGNGQWSWVIAGMEWAATETDASIISMSLGGDDVAGVDPVEEAVNRLSAQTGVLFVIAAGNRGPTAQSVDSPGSADAALTVAAVDRNDVLASFSGRGPRDGDHALKPDIAAPGVGIAAARAAGTTMPGSAPVDEFYTRVSGTSMATPHVAGAAALLVQQHPDWTSEQLKSALTSSVDPVPGTSPYQAGAGRLDAAAAVTAEVHATTSSLSFGYLRWPYSDAEPVTRTVGYRNDSDQPVTLDLTIAATDSQGAPAPAGMFGVSPGQVTVPAGASAEVAVTFAPGTGGTGLFGGTLTATSADGEHVARVAFGGEKEPESYDVTVNALDRTGAVPGAGTLFNMVIFFDHATGTFHGPVPSGSTLRLPAGTYAANAYISTARPGRTAPAMAQMAIPEVEVTADAVLTLDSRAAQKIEFSVDDDPGAVLQYRYQHMFVKYPNGLPVSYFGWTMGTTADWDEMYVSGANSSENFAFAAQARLVDGAGTAYNLTFPHEHEVPDLDFRVDRDDLGRVDSIYRGLGGPTSVSIGALPAYFDRFLFKLSELVTVPASRTEYFTAGVPFHQTVEPLAWTPMTTLDAGERRGETFNAAVIGPSLSTPPPPSFTGYGAVRPAWAYRDGNVVDVRLPMLVGTGGEHLPAMQPSLPIPSAVRLFRDGVLLGESSQQVGGRFGAPAEAADFRLEAFAACNTAFCGLSSPAASATWTFRGAATSGPVALPLMAVRYEPRLDENNRAAAATPFTFPLRVESESGVVRYQEISSLRVEASYDDGGSWHEVTARRVGHQWRVTVQNPPSGNVSLRASVTDVDGNTVEQTVLRAYGVGS